MMTHQPTNMITWKSIFEKRAPRRRRSHHRRLPALGQATHTHISSSLAAGEATCTGGGRGGTFPHLLPAAVPVLGPVTLNHSSRLRGCGWGPMRKHNGSTLRQSSPAAVRDERRWYIYACCVKGEGGDRRRGEIKIRPRVWVGPR
jgi:hypothetical protein